MQDQIINSITLNGRYSLYEKNPTRPRCHFCTCARVELGRVTQEAFGQRGRWPYARSGGLATYIYRCHQEQSVSSCLPNRPCHGSVHRGLGIDNPTSWCLQRLSCFCDPLNGADSSRMYSQWQGPKFKREQALPHVLAIKNAA